MPTGKRAQDSTHERVIPGSGEGQAHLPILLLIGDFASLR